MPKLSPSKFIEELSIKIDAVALAEKKDKFEKSEVTRKALFDLQKKLQREENPTEQWLQDELAIAYLQEYVDNRKQVFGVLGNTTEKSELTKAYEEIYRDPKFADNIGKISDKKFEKSFLSTIKSQTVVNFLTNKLYTEFDGATHWQGEINEAEINKKIPENVRVDRITNIMKAIARFSPVAWPLWSDALQARGAKPAELKLFLMDDKTADLQSEPTLRKQVLELIKTTKENSTKVEVEHKEELISVVSPTNKSFAAAIEANNNNQTAPVRTIELEKIETALTATDTVSPSASSATVPAASAVAPIATAPTSPGATVPAVAPIASVPISSSATTAPAAPIATSFSATVLASPIAPAAPPITTSLTTPTIQTAAPLPSMQTNRAELTEEKSEAPNTIIHKQPDSPRPVKMISPPVSPSLSSTALMGQALKGNTSLSPVTEAAPPAPVNPKPATGKTLLFDANALKAEIERRKAAKQSGAAKSGIPSSSTDPKSELETLTNRIAHVNLEEKERKFKI